MDDQEDCSVVPARPTGVVLRRHHVLNGVDLKMGTNVVSIRRAVKCQSGNDLDFTLVMSYTAT